ncbi:MAG: pilus assembly protein [Pirellulales bacterium]
MEFAILVPVLMVLAMGCTDLGRVFHTYLIVSNAARCGADYAATHNPAAYDRASWEAVIRETVDTEMRGFHHYEAGRLDVEISSTDEGGGLYRVAVTASYPHESIVNWPGVPAIVGLSHQVQMRRTR